MTPMNSLARWISAAACTAAVALAASAPGASLISERIFLAGGLVHYRFDVVVGPGPFDVIRMHRVIKEQQPGQLVVTPDAVMLLHGNPLFFEGNYMAPLFSPSTAWDHSIAIFLAKNNVDVWGMDWAWSQVPEATTDFGFMRGWGLEKDAQHAAVAVAIARWIRSFTGQGQGPIHLGGLSYGALHSYLAASRETQLPQFQRNIKGIIPIDWGVRFSDEAMRSYSCTMIAADQEALQQGYNNDTGLFLGQLGSLAVSSPGAPSPMVDGLTNLQAAQAMGTTTSLFNGQPWHFVGGFLDANDIPTGLRFTDPQLWLDMLQTSPPHYPAQIDLETDQLICGAGPSPWDDGVRQIALPIFYGGAAGGIGKTGYYTTTLTASKDITRLVVQALPDDQTKSDWGHGDTVYAKEAETKLWKPILDWIQAHR